MGDRRLFIAVLLGLALGGPVGAEDRVDDPHDRPRMFALRDTSAVRNLIDEFHQTMQQGRAAIALRTAQRVLDDHADDFYLLDGKDAAGWISTRDSVLWRSAAEVIRDELAALSPRRRDVYERLAGPSATPLLRRALARRSEADLREVLRRYGASTAGIEAGRALAALSMADGRYRDAAWFAREALRFAPRDPGLWQLRIDGLVRAKDHDALLALRLPADLPPPADGAGPDVRAWLAAARERTPAPEAARDWPIWCGNDARVRRFPYDAPVPRSLRWTEHTDFVSRSRDHESGWFRESREHPKYRAKLQQIRPTHAVAADRRVYAADGRSLRAYDIYSGRKLWSFDAARYPGGRGAPFPMLNAGQSYPGRTNLDRAFAPVVVDDLVIGTVEERLPYYPDRLQQIEISMYLPRRRLVACDRKTGDLRWVFAADGVDRLRFLPYSIASSPAVAEGIVLALGSRFEGSHNLVFFGIDAKTGRLRWSRELASGQQELNLFGVPVKELAASPITVADGTAYVSTGLGFVAALDVRSGVPRWLASYEILPIRAVDYWYRAPLRVPVVAASPPRAYADTLVVAPTDGRFLYVFDRHTGRLRWRQPIVVPSSSSSMDWDMLAHVIGVVNDGRRDVVLTTDSRLVARYLRDDPATPDVDERGQLAWAGLDVNRIQGQGVVAGASVVVPAAEGLFRFSLHGEGKQEAGQVPWPEGSEPGNLLPLERVLIVAGRDKLQWFYDWEDLERDIARRRREHPDDPSVLLEAGELYLRAGDETQRARKAFQEALRIARRSAPAFVAHARRGLHLAWRLAGDRARDQDPEQAQQAYERALAQAATPEERIAVRIRLGALLTGDAEAERANIERLEAEAEDAMFVFDKALGPVPARAEAILWQGRLLAAQGKPRAAIDTFQRAIRMLGATPYATETVRDQAQQRITEIIAAAGRRAYAAHERKARALVDKARRTGDAALLERVIQEYPNAEVLGDALLVRAGQQLAAGKATAAIALLRQVLSGDGERRTEATALALLARAYRVDGSRGAAALTLDRLDRRFPDARVSVDGGTVKVAAFVAAERGALPRAPAPPAPGLGVPLAEIRFEPGADETTSRALHIVTTARADGTPTEARVAVMLNGPQCTVFDLAQGTVAWRSSPGSAQQGAWIPGAGVAGGPLAAGRLILAVRDRIRGFDDGSGTELWSHPVGGFVREFRLHDAVLYAVVQENNLAGTSRLLALDGMHGRLLWSRDLGPDSPRRLGLWRDRVLLERTRWHERRNEAHLLTFDAFDGRALKQVSIPTQRDAQPVLAGGALIVAARETDTREGRTVRRLVAYDLVQGTARWRRTILDPRPVTALVTDGSDVLALLSSGIVLTVRAEDGEVIARTQIHVGSHGTMRPFVQSRMLVDKHTLTFLPAVRPSTRTRPAEPAVMCFDRRTGKLRWVRPYKSGTDLNAAQIMRHGNVLAVVISHRKNYVPHVNIRLLDASDGRLLQEIAPDELAQPQWIPSAQAGYGSLVVFGKRGASVFRPRAESAGSPSGK